MDDFVASGVHVRGADRYWIWPVRRSSVRGRSTRQKLVSARSQPRGTGNTYMMLVPMSKTQRGRSSVLTKLCAILLLVLALSPFTAPFQRCDFADSATG